MMYDVYKSEKDLNQLIDRALRGEEVVLTKGGRQVAKIISLEKPVRRNKTVLGNSCHEGKIIGDLQGPFIPEEDWHMLRDDFEL